jgi:Citrate transporter
MPPISTVLLSDAQTLAAYLIFVGSYLGFALGKFPWMKIDRPGAAIIGAVLMVAFRIVGPHEALQSIDFATIVLLFSMMLVVANLRIGGFFERVTEWAIVRLHPHHLLPTVIFMTGLLSAFLVNDVVCLVMTPFVVHMAQRLRLPSVPYVIAVATRLEHRQRRDHHRQPAKHADWLGLGYRLSRVHCSPRTRSRRRASPELVSDPLALAAESRRSGQRRGCLVSSGTSLEGLRVAFSGRAQPVWFRNLK